MTVSPQKTEMTVFVGTCETESVSKIIGVSCMVVVCNRRFTHPNKEDEVLLYPEKTKS